MRRGKAARALILRALAVIAAGALVGEAMSTSEAAAASPTGVYDCHSRSIRVVFSHSKGSDPAGVPSRVEVYLGTGKRYRAADRVATVTVEGADIAARCTKDPSAQGRRRRQMREKQRGGTSIAVECSASRSFLLSFLDYGSAPDALEQRGVLVSTVPRNVLYAIVGVRESVPNDFGKPVYQFDESVCRKVDGPH